MYSFVLADRNGLDTEPRLTDLQAIGSKCPSTRLDLITFVVDFVNNKHERILKGFQQWYIAEPSAILDFGCRHDEHFWRQSRER